MALDETTRMLNLLDEDGKPHKGGINRFNRNWELFENDTIPGVLVELKPQIDAIKAMFAAGDREGLVRELARTAPVRFKDSGLSMGRAQVLNDAAGLALCCLEGRLDSDGLIRPLRYQYQSHLGQSSGDVERAHMAHLSGAGSPEQQAAALELFKDRNPEDTAVLLRQESALKSIRGALGIAVEQQQ